MMPTRRSTMRSARIVSLVVVIGLSRAASRAAGPAPPTGPQVPVALAWGHDGLLRVALRDARAVARVDPRTWTVVARHDVPVRPASMARVPGEATLLLGGTD